MSKKAILIFFATFIILGCKSEQEKALNEAITSKSITSLHDFYNQYGDSLNEKVKEKYLKALDLLVQDSTLFANVENAGSSLIKYSAAKEYISTLPKGAHFKDVKEIIPKYQEDAEKLSEKMEEFRHAFSQYKFIETIYSETFPEETDEYEFFGPDESGKGDVIIKAKNYNVQVNVDPWTYRRGFLTRNCSGTYYINDDLKIVITVIEERSYSRAPGAKDYGEKGNRELLDFLKQQYPNPEPRKIILTYYESDGFPAMEGKDSNRKECSFESVMK